MNSNLNQLQPPVPRRQQAAASRTPLLPKELIVPLCQRMALVLFAMCSTALGIRLYGLWSKGNVGHWGQPEGATMTHVVNGSHFFLDIGSGHNGRRGLSRTKKLEETGWVGVCADPFPDADRKCTAVSMPVTPKTGDSVKLNDCREQSSPLQVMLSAVDMQSGIESCPQVDRAGVSVQDVLKLSKAPSVIDYISLDTQGSELEILQGFPFKDFCARSWTVIHGDKTAEAKGQIAELLEDRNCRLVTDDRSLWARCPCSYRAQSLLNNHASAVSHATVVTHADGMVSNIVRKEEDNLQKKGRKSKHHADAALVPAAAAEPEQVDSESLVGLEKAPGMAHTPLVH